MTLIASIITFSKKKNPKIKCYPRHGTLALDMEPSTLDPRQKDRPNFPYSIALTACFGVRMLFDFQG